MQTRVRPINMAAELAPALAELELPVAQQAQELELRPALELRRALVEAQLELSQVAELRPAVVKLQPSPVEAVVIRWVTTLRQRHPRAVVPLAVDLAEARLAPAAAEGRVAWVGQKAEAAVQEEAVAVVAEAVEAGEDVEGKTNDRGKNNENKTAHHDLLENFADRFGDLLIRFGSRFVCGPNR